MAIVQSASFQFGLLLATALSVAMLPTAGEAYTPEQQQACSDDAFRLCGPEIPDVDRVTACMVSKKAAAFAGLPGVLQARPGAGGGRRRAAHHQAGDSRKPHKARKPARRGAT